MKPERFIEGQLVAFINGSSLMEPLAVLGIVESIDADVLLVRHSKDHYMKVPYMEAFPVQNELFINSILGREPASPEGGSK